MKRAIPVTVAILAILAAALAPAAAVAGTRNKDASINGAWVGTYTSNCGAVYGMTWDIIDNGDGTLLVDTVMTKNQGQPDEFRIYLYDQPGTYNPGTGAISVDTYLIMHVLGIGGTPRDMTMLTASDGDVDDPANPATITCDAVQKLTYPPFIPRQVEIDRGLTVLTKSGKGGRQFQLPYPGHYPRWLPPRVPLPRNERDLVGQWHGKVSSDLNPDGWYEVGFDVTEEHSGGLTCENFLLKQDCDESHHHNMEAFFPSVEGTRSGAQISMALNIVFETTTGTQTISIGLTGTIANNTNVAGTYDIDAVIRGISIPVDHGTWDGMKKGTRLRPALP